MSKTSTFSGPAPVKRATFYSCFLSSCVDVARLLCACRWRRRLRKTVNSATNTPASPTAQASPRSLLFHWHSGHLAPDESSENDNLLYPEGTSGCCIRLCRSLIFLDGGAIIQNDNTLPASAFNTPALSLNPKDATWQAAVQISAPWLALADVGRLGMGPRAFFPRLMRAGWPRLLRAAFLHILYTTAIVVSSVVLLPGIQHAIAGDAPPGSPSAIVYAFGFFLSDIARMLLHAKCLQEARLAGHVMQKVVQATLLTRAASLGPGQAAGGRALVTVALDTSGIQRTGEQLYLLLALPIESCAILAVMAWLVGIPAIPTLIAAPIIWGVLLWLAWIDSDPPGWINLMLRLTRDVLRGMPTIQMLGWEAAMLERIQQIRDGHLTAILRLRTLVFVATTLSLALAPLGVLAAVLIAWAQGVTLPVTFVLFINLFGALRSNLQQNALAMRARESFVYASNRVKAMANLTQPSGALIDGELCTLRAVAQPTSVCSIISEEAASSLASYHLKRCPYQILSDSKIKELWREHTSRADPPPPEYLIAMHKLSAKFFTPQVSRGKIPFVLRDITLGVRRGTVLAVVGLGGAGKSALLSTILGDMTRVHGISILRGSVAVTTQTVWLEACSIRENIVFGRPFHRQWYTTVVRACGLESFCAGLEQGDGHLVGEGGGELSAGQRASIAFARALYGDADVYVLDDPFKDYDPDFAMERWRTCIRDLLTARGKAVVFASQQVALIELCDKVVLLEDGAMTFMGPPAQLFATHAEIAFAADPRTDDIGPVDETSLPSPLPPSLPSPLPSLASDRVFLRKTASRDSVRSVASTDSMPRELLRGRWMNLIDGAANRFHKNLSKATGISQKDEHSSLITVLQESDYHATEFQHSGEVGFPSLQAISTTFFEYIRADQGNIAIGAIVFAIAAVGSQQVYKWWLAILLTGMRDRVLFSSWLLPVFSAIVASYVVALVICGLTIRYIAYRSSKYFHRAAVISLLRAPLSFFLSTPAGDLLTIMSRDLEALDKFAPSALNSLTDLIASMGGVICAIALQFPPLFAGAALAFALSSVVWFMYRTGAERYSTAEIVASERVTTLFIDFISGGQVIRQLGRKDEYLKRAAVFVHELGAINMANFALARWQGIRLDFIASLMLLGTAMFCSYDTVVTPALAGLACSNALTFSVNFSSLANTFVALITSLAAVSRFIALTHIHPAEHWPEPGEPLQTLPKGARAPPDSALLAALRSPRRSAARKAKYPYAGWDPECWVQRLRSSGWPQHGQILIDRVSTRYAPGLPAVLKRITLNMRGRSITCVLSKDGGGATTLVRTIARLLEPDPRPSDSTSLTFGRVFIDGIDTTMLPVAQLRAAMGFVPPEPALFSILTVAQNIDPTGTAPLADLWAALRVCKLDGVIRALPKGLDTQMSDNGADLSESHRQLLCFARMLVRQPRILILDNATAAFDAVSDEVIQNCLFAAASSSSVINITHHLRMLISADRILSLNAGEVVDYDAPSALLGITRLEEAKSVHAFRGALIELVKSTGPDEETHLRGLAAAGFIRRRLIGAIRAKRMAKELKPAPPLVSDATAGPVIVVTIDREEGDEIAAEGGTISWHPPESVRIDDPQCTTSVV